MYYDFMQSKVAQNRNNKVININANAPALIHYTT